MRRQLDILFDRSKSEDGVLCRDERTCRKKIELLREGGHTLLQVISDFDWTMSHYMVDGKNNIGSYGVMKYYPSDRTNINEEHDNLFNEYYPIMVDSSRTNDAKIPYMVEWWTQAHDVMINSNITQTVFEETIKKCGLALRIDCDKFMATLNTHGIPLLILSAGIGNVIDNILKEKRLLFDNVRIISNFMNFNKDGTLIGFHDPLIHSFNKNVDLIHDIQLETNRKNVMLVGDSSGDPNMTDGLADDHNVLKIGFLNEKIEDQKNQFMNIYDIVLVSDESFNIPRLILDAVLNNAA